MNSVSERGAFFLQKKDMIERSKDIGGQYERTPAFPCKISKQLNFSYRMFWQKTI